MEGRIEPAIQIDGQSFRVLAFSLDEGISEVPVLVCRVFDDTAPLPRPNDVIGKRARFTLSRDDGSETRTFWGALVRAELGPGEDDVPVLTVESAPRLWELGRRFDCRIFQDKNVREIVTEVLRAAQIPEKTVEWKLREEPQKRVYVAQYRETDLDFLLRLLSEEGIWFVCLASDDEERLVFSDAADGLGEIEGSSTLEYFEEFGVEAPSGRVHRVERVQSVRSDRVFVRDYDPEKPSTLVEGKAEGTDDGAHELEIYEYPARVLSPTAARKRARVLLESAQAERDILTGETSSLGLLLAHRFSIAGHPYDPINEEYLLTRTTLRGSYPRSFSKKPTTLRLGFRAIPTSASQCRPPRRIREQTLPGVQTAITTGPSGEEIHTDKSGRVKVFYRWDRLGKKDDSSSQWIRTTQLATGGSMLLPRMGWEVVVAHQDGDVDRPILFGRMYNALSPPPYALPGHSASSAWQTGTTPGGGSVNELRASDSKGKETLSFTASKDMKMDVLEDVTETIGHDWKKKVGTSQAESVTNSITEVVSGSSSVSVGGDQSTKVETFLVEEIAGNHSLTIGGDRNRMIGGDHRMDVGGSSSLSVGSMSVDLVVGAVSEHALGSYKSDVGAAKVELAIGNRTVIVGGDRTETAGALKLIAASGGRAVEVGGSLNTKVGGAIVDSGSGAHVEKAGGTYTEVAAGAHIVKAKEVVFEAQGMLCLVMGASTLTILPAAVIVAGISVKLDGDVSDLGIVIDN